MDEDFAFLLVLAFMAVSAYAIVLRFWVVRRLRKKLEQTTGATIAAARPAIGKQPSQPVQAEADELRRIQERLRVLERITVDKENSLSREIEQLRAER